MLSTNDSAEAYGYSFADPISLQSVKKDLDKPGPQSVEKNGTEGDARFF
jgi:hypothetical protein